MASPLEQVILQSLFKVSAPQLRAPPLEEQIALINSPQFLEGSGKGPQWQAMMRQDALAAAQAGIPYFEANSTQTPSRLRLQDAISRSGKAGFAVPHFIGNPNEPTGDRGVTMDVENLVNALRLREQAALSSGDAIGAQQIARERAYWEGEVNQGMSAEEWTRQTGLPDLIRPQ